jgi:hypothetical protein
MTVSVELFLLFGIPWILDLTGGRHVLATAFGAILWGIALVLAVVRPQTTDARLKALLGWVLSFVCGAWLTYWGLAFLEAPQPAAIEPETLRSLTLLHAGLLAAGVGMVFIHGLAAGVWLLQEASLRKSSWARRSKRLPLPSLESCAKLCERSLQSALLTWGAGMSVALVTGVLRWGHTWIGDPRILLSLALAGLLYGTFGFARHLRDSGRGLYATYLTFSTVFLLGFAVLMSLGSDGPHEPIRWFVR